MLGAGQLAHGYMQAVLRAFTLHIGKPVLASTDYLDALWACFGNEFH